MATAPSNNNGYNNGYNHHNQYNNNDRRYGSPPGSRSRSHSPDNQARARRETGGKSEAPILVATDGKTYLPMTFSDGGGTLASRNASAIRTGSLRYHHTL